MNFEDANKVVTRFIIVVFSLIIIIGAYKAATVKGEKNDTETSYDDLMYEEANGYQEDYSDTDEVNGFEYLEQPESSERSLQDMPCVEDRFYNSSGSVQTLRGEEFTNYTWCVLSESGFGDDRLSEEYIVQGEFNRFTGKLFLPGDRAANEQFKMIAYADGSQIYESPLIDKASRTEYVEIDIPNGTDIFKIDFVMVNGVASMTTGWYPQSGAYIANPLFINTALANEL